MGGYSSSCVIYCYGVCMRKRAFYTALLRVADTRCCGLRCFIKMANGSPDTLYLSINTRLMKFILSPGHGRSLPGPRQDSLTPSPAADPRAASGKCHGRGR